jgi:hypothetical protein
MTQEVPEGSNQAFPDIDDLLAQMAPAQTPADALVYAPKIAEALSPLDALKTVAALTGMMTDPRFQAHNARLDFAVRLVLSLAQGKRRAKSDDLAELLNPLLDEARVARLEDPIEDFFVESIPTSQGDVLIFSGLWEQAGFYTELLLQAFEHLPRASQKRAILREVYALLTLSNTIAKRSEVERRTVGGGAPKDDIAVPSDMRLGALARRVKFTVKEIGELGIAMDDLAPFFLADYDTPSLLSIEPGNSGLELRPLLQTPNGIIVATPCNITTAVRAHLIHAALAYGMDEQLQHGLLHAGAMLMRQSGFGLRPAGNIQRCDDQLYRETMFELSPGRFVHLVQSADGFSHWPHVGFASMLPCTQKWMETLQASMQKAKADAQNREGFVEGVTIWIVGGWGCGRGFPQFDEHPEWPLIALAPADALVLGACKDGKLADIWRIEKQIRLVKEQGFDLHNMSGMLNMFRWWQVTDHALVPPNEITITPPMFVDFDTALLLETRKEGANALDRRSVLHPNGSRHLVSRLEQDEMAKAFDGVYASLGDAMQGRLTGVVLNQDVGWWFEDDSPSAPGDKSIFENWRTALLWAARVMPMFLRKMKRRGIAERILFKTRMSDMAGGSFAESVVSDDEIDAAVGVAIENKGQWIRIQLGPAWSAGAYRVDNYAEIALAAAILDGACRLHGIDVSAVELRAWAFTAAGSADFRHRHAHQALRAIDRLSARGLAGSFREIPISTSALIRCGSVWPSHPRANGVVFEGKQACVELLEGFRAERLQSFRRQVARYNRKSLVHSAMTGLQAALADESHWARSARAQAAIYGPEEDFRISIAHNSRSNGVIRANSMLVEFAICEASLDGGLTAGRMDLEELQPRAVQLFYIGDLLPGYYADRIEPSIHLSPTGDVLHHHEFENRAIRAGAELRHSRSRKTDRENYIGRFSEAKAVTDHELSDTIEEEYSTPSGLWRDFPYALVDICIARNTGTLIIARSELIRELKAIDYVGGHDYRALIDRLTLRPRDGWDDVLTGAQPSDFDFSKYDRRFSLIARPLVALSNDADPELVIAPGVVERAYAHNLNGAASGTLQNDFWQSEKMRSYASAAGAKAGLQFNELVASTMGRMGLRTWASAKPSWCLNFKNTDELKRLGDIDVLAVSPDGGKVWVIEAKDLKLCRTMGEASRRLSDYRGQFLRNGKPDKLLRHQDRVSFLRKHANRLMGPLGLDAEPVIHGALVVNAPQPMQQLHSEYSADSTVVMLDHLDRVPWSIGWSSRHERHIDIL